MSRVDSTGSAGDVIDGRFSSSFSEPIEAGFVAIEVGRDKKRESVCMCV